MANLTKAEFSELLHKLNIPIEEGTTGRKEENIYPKIVYWAYCEEDIMASGEAWVNRVTYQLSYFDRRPQGEKIKELRKLLREKGIYPQFFHEYVENDPVFSKTWHTYFSIEIDEEIE